MQLGHENNTQDSCICVKPGKGPLLTLRLENHIESMDDAREVFKAAEENVDELGAAAPVYKEMEMGGKGDQSSSILAAAALTSAITQAHLPSSKFPLFLQFQHWLAQ